MTRHDRPGTYDRDAELQWLRMRLEEAEATIEAIRNGAVDAVVGHEHGPAGPRMYTRLGADKPYRLIVEQMAEGAVTLDLDGTILYCNPRFAEMLQVPHRAVIGRAMGDLVLADGRAAFARFLAAGIAGPTRLETVLGTSQDTAVPVYLSAAPLAEDGARGISVVVTDLTERKREEARRLEVEEARRASEARYRAYFDNACDALFVVDADRDGQFIYAVNPRAEALFGAAADEMRGRAIETILPGDAGGRLLAELHACVSSGTPHRFEETLSFRVGTRICDAILVPVRDASGRIVQVFGTARDITEQRRTEEALRQAQKVESLGQLTGGIAHDFNNLLTAVLGNLELIERRVENDPRALKFVRGATHAAERGAKLTGQLLAFARKQHLNPEPVDVNAVVTGMEDLLHRTLGPAVRLQGELQAGVWPALADANQLELVVLNLAINARDAMPAGGTLTIRTANVQAGHPDLPADLGDDAPGYVLLSVADTGTGMPPEVCAKAFDPFFTTKDVGKGTGLGLSQVHGVAKQSGGGVRLCSQPGRGTTVEVYLKRAEIAAAMPASGSGVPGGPRHGHGATILVVDDDADVRELTVTCLAGLGYRTIEAQNGDEALGMLERGERVDLLMADLAMPGISGADLARIARRQRPQLGILLVTGYADAEMLRKGADEEVLKKPFKVADLADKVSEMLVRSDDRPEIMDTSARVAHVRPGRRSG